MLQEKLAGVSATIGVGAGGFVWLDVLHKVVQTGSGIISMIAGAFAIYMYVKGIIEKRKGK